MSGDPNLLIIKAILDLFTAAIFGAFLGHTLAFVAIPQFILQAALFFAATWIMPLVSPVMLADFSAAGGIILLATGLKICGVVPFPVIGMLPSLVLIMPFSWAWLQIFP